MPAPPCVRVDGPQPYRQAAHASLAILTAQHGADAVGSIRVTGFGPVPGRLVVVTASEYVRCVLLSHQTAVMVVRVDVVLAVPEPARTRIVAVTQVCGHLADQTASDIGFGRANRLDHRVRLGRE